MIACIAYFEESNAKSLDVSVVGGLKFIITKEDVPNIQH